MVTRVSSSSPSQALGRTPGFSPTATKVVCLALVFFVVALAIVAVKTLKGGRVQPSRPREPFISMANVPLSSEGVDSLKTKLLQTAQVAAGSKDGYSTFLPWIIDILEKENGIVGMKEKEEQFEEEEQFIYQTYQGYPYALVAVLGGREAFDKIPTGVIERDQLYQLQEGLNPYVRIDPKKMTHSIMKYSDPNGRPVLAIRFRRKCAEEDIVDIFLCRDPEAGRWYHNQERSPEIFSLHRGQIIHFIERLYKGTHPTLELHSTIR